MKLCLGREKVILEMTMASLRVGYAASIVFPYFASRPISINRSRTGSIIARAAQLTKLMACLIALLPNLAHAQDQLAPLNTIPSARDVLGSPPSQFVWLRNGLQLVRDPVDGNLVFINDAGKIVGRAAVPADFQITRIEPGAAEVRFIDRAAGRQFVVPRDVAPGQFHNVVVTESAGGRSIVSDLRRIDSRHLVILIPGSQPIDVRSAHGGELTDAYPIGSDSAGNRYVEVEEIVSSSPKLDVRATIEKFNPVGQLIGIVNIPLSGMDVVPRDFASVTNAGQIRVLFPRTNGVDIREFSITPTKPVNLKTENKITPIAGGRSLGVSPTIKIETNVKKVDGAGNFQSDPKGRSMAAARGARPAPRARTLIISTAKSYLTVNWTLKKYNWIHDGVENACDKARHQFWLRPLHFTATLIGTSIGPVPYAWGGDDTPQSFMDKVTNQRALAGDVCTCRAPALNDCIFPKAAGIDCSGFVSRAWGVTKRGTSQLFNIASRIRVNDLKPGDALNWPGHHVRLLVSVDRGPAIAFHVIESTAQPDCEGVCERVYRATELNDYTPIRFSKVVDQ